MRVLLTDIMFPNKYAKWRLVEIKSFIEKYDCDIMVINRINRFACNIFEFDTMKYYVKNINYNLLTKDIGELKDMYVDSLTHYNNNCINILNNEMDIFMNNILNINYFITLVM